MGIAKFLIALCNIHIGCENLSFCESARKVKDRFVQGNGFSFIFKNWLVSSIIGTFQLWYAVFYMLIIFTLTWLIFPSPETYLGTDSKWAEIRKDTKCDGCPVVEYVVSLVVSLVISGVATFMGPSSVVEMMNSGSMAMLTLYTAESDRVKNAAPELYTEFEAMRMEGVERSPLVAGYVQTNTLTQQQPAYQQPMYQQQQPQQYGTNYGQY